MSEEEQPRYTRMARRPGEREEGENPQNIRGEGAPAYISLTSAGYNERGEPLWLNAKLALAQLGFESPPDYIGISPSYQVLEKAWTGLIAERWAWPYPGQNIPTWVELVEAERLAVLDSTKRDAIRSLIREGQRRVDMTCQDDLGIVLPGQHTPEQIAKCNRLHARIVALRDSISTSRTEGELFSINVRDESLWETANE